MKPPTCKNGKGLCFEVRCDECPHRINIVAGRALRPPKLYIDLDGVFADYDKRASELLGMDHYKYEYVYGTEQYWHKLSQDKAFWINLELIPDASELIWALRGRPYTILTALPRGDKDTVASQKQAWVELNLGPNVPVICVDGALHKAHHSGPTDILVDDRNIVASHWRDKGGDFILHVSAKLTIEHLRHLKVVE
jgi:hypothetical protein